MPKTKIKKKQLPFIEHLVVKDLYTKKIQKSIFPAKRVQVGYNECGHELVVKGPIISDCATATTVLSGNLVVLGTTNISGSGEANDGDNVGGGTGEIYRGKTGATLDFKTLVGAGTVTVINGADTITISGTGDGGGGGGGATESLFETLKAGQETGGRDILITNGDVILGQSGTTGINAFIVGGTGSAGAGGVAGALGGSGISGGAGYLWGGNGSAGLGGSIFIRAGTGSVGGGEVHIQPGAASSNPTANPTPTVNIYAADSSFVIEYPDVFKLWSPGATIFDDYHSSSWKMGTVSFGFLPDGEVSANSGSFFIHPGPSLGGAGGTRQYPGLFIKRTNTGNPDEKRQWWEFEQCYTSGSSTSAGTPIQVDPFEALLTDPSTGPGQTIYQGIWIELKVQAAYSSVSDVQATYARKMRFFYRRGEHTTGNGEPADDLIYDYLSLPITTGDGSTWDAHVILTGGLPVLALTGSTSGTTNWSMSLTACDTAGAFVNRGFNPA